MTITTITDEMIASSDEYAPLSLAQLRLICKDRGIKPGNAGHDTLVETLLTWDLDIPEEEIAEPALETAEAEIEPEEDEVQPAPQARPSVVAAVADNAEPVEYELLKALGCRLIPSGLMYIAVIDESLAGGIELRVKNADGSRNTFAFDSYSDLFAYAAKNAPRVDLGDLTIEKHQGFHYIYKSGKPVDERGNEVPEFSPTHAKNKYVVDAECNAYRINGWSYNDGKVVLAMRQRASIENAHTNKNDDETASKAPREPRQQKAKPLYRVEVGGIVYEAETRKALLEKLGMSLTQPQTIAPAVPVAQ